MNIYTNIANLAKSVKYQNLFTVAKDIKSIRLFRNDSEFSKLQDIFLSYLYTFEAINRDIIIEKISKHVFDEEIMWDSYLLWKKQAKKKEDRQSSGNKKSDVNLVVGRKIKFPQRGK